MQKNSHRRKQIGVAVAAAFALTAFMPTLSVASPDVVVGNLVKFVDGPGSPGGEFGIDVLPVVGTNFITFCLEYNEYINFGSTYKVASVGTAAINGGVGGGNPDPISNATAYLYTQFRAGSLAGYLGDVASANSLQNAIWFLENEIGSVSGQALTWANLGLANGTGLGNVRVMNLTTLSGEVAQDQLMMVPEPETYAMLLAGLGLMGFVARRRQRKLAAA